MLSRDEEVARELAAERTDEELAEALSGYKGKRFAWWRVLLGVLAVLCVLWVWISNIDSVNKMSVFTNLVGDYGYEELVEEENLRVMRKRDLWKSNPENKAYLMDYVCSDINDDKSEELLDIAFHVDPENSYYYYLVVAQGLGSRENKYLEKVKPARGSYSATKDYGKIVEWKVLDKERYEEAQRNLLKAGAGAGIIDRTFSLRLEEMEKYRIAKENGRMDCMDQMLAGYKVVSDLGLSMKMLNLNKLFEAKFYELSQEGTKEEVQLWMGEYYRLIGELLAKGGTIVDYLVARSFIQGGLGNMRAAAINVGMVEEAEKISTYIEVLNEERAKKEAELAAKRAGRKVAVDVRGKDDGSFYSKDPFLISSSREVMLRYLKEPQKVAIPSSKEGRMADHAFAGRAMSLLALVFLLLIMIAMWVFYFAKRKKVREFSIQGLGALKVTDGLMVILLGVILPLLCYLLVNEWSVAGLSVREWSIVAESSALAVIQFLGMFVTVLSLSVAILHWRLRVRLPELVDHLRLLRWVLPALSFSAMILIGVADRPNDTLALNLSGTFLSLSFLGWMVLGMIAAFIKNNELTRVLLCRSLTSVYTFCVVIFTGLQYHYHAQERQWVSLSEEVTFKKEDRGMMKLEYEVTKQMRKELISELDMIR